MSFDFEFANVLYGNISPFPAVLLKIDTRNPTAYFIGKKIASHYFDEDRKKEGINNYLKVKELLDVSGLRSIAQIRKTNRNWKAGLKRPLENALENLIQIGFLEDWEYSQAPKSITKKSKKGSLESALLYSPPLQALEGKETEFIDYEIWADTFIQIKIKE